MAAVYEDESVLKFFEQRVGQVEVLRNGTLEFLYFDLPPVARNPDMAKTAQSKAIAMIDKQARDDSSLKLSGFLEGAYLICSVLMAQSKVSVNMSKFWSLRTRPTCMLSVLLMLDAALSTDGNYWSWQSSTFARWDLGFAAFIVLAAAHLLLTLSIFQSFVQIRFPVLLQAVEREDMMHYYKTVPNAMNPKKTTRVEFVER
jgi:hypothetical protein